MLGGLLKEVACWIRYGSDRKLKIAVIQVGSDHSARHVLRIALCDRVPTCPKYSYAATFRTVLRRSIAGTSRKLQ